MARHPLVSLRTVRGAAVLVAVSSLACACAPMGGSDGPNDTGGTLGASGQSANAAGGAPGAPSGADGGVAGLPVNAAGNGGANASGGAGVAGQPLGGGADGLAQAGSAGAATTPGSYPFIFAVFNDSAPKSDLVIYVSTDALNFTLLYDTGYTGPTGFLRDPSIMKHSDGKFYVAFTTPPDLGCCGAENSFSIASSSNLKDWTTVATVPAGVAGVKNTWAPEWFKDRDGSVHALVTLDGKTYDYKAMNDALTQFSAPTWIGIGPGFIDTFIVTIGETYHAFAKGNAYIEHATASSVDGPWTFVGTGDWSGWGTHKEAGAIIDLGNGTWRFFCDAGSTGHEVSSDSKDMFKTWTPPKTLPGVGNNISHGTVIKGN